QLVRRRGGGAGGLEVDIEAGLFVPAHLLRVEVRRVIAACDPVERERELLRRGGRRPERNESRKSDGRSDLHAELQIEKPAHRPRRAASVRGNCVVTGTIGAAPYPVNERWVS